jgi:hypothetical protein
MNSSQVTSEADPKVQASDFASERPACSSPAAHVIICGEVLLGISRHWGHDKQDDS